MRQRLVVLRSGIEIHAAPEDLPRNVRRYAGGLNPETLCRRVIRGNWRAHVFHADNSMVTCAACIQAERRDLESRTIVLTIGN